MFKQSCSHYESDESDLARRKADVSYQFLDFDNYTNVFSLLPNHISPVVSLTKTMATEQCIIHKCKCKMPFEINTESEPFELLNNRRHRRKTHDSPELMTAPAATADFKSIHHTPSTPSAEVPTSMDYASIDFSTRSSSTILSTSIKSSAQIDVCTLNSISCKVWKETQLDCTDTSTALRNDNVENKSSQVPTQSNARFRRRNQFFSHKDDNHDALKQRLQCRIMRFALLGAGFGGFFALFSILFRSSPALPSLFSPCSVPLFASSSFSSFPASFLPFLRKRRKFLRAFTYVDKGIQTYIDLFSKHEKFSSYSRKLAGTGTMTGSGKGADSRSSTSNGNSAAYKNYRGPTLVIAGKMTVDDGSCNIAQYDLSTSRWSLTERIQLSLYNSYSGGEVYSLLANHTVMRSSSASDSSSRNSEKKVSRSINRSRSARSSSSASSEVQQGTVVTTSYSGSGELIVVGAFDTTYRNSQVTYCSVGVWDGFQLSKVGEGLCNSALSKGMKITTAALAGPQDVYVAGSFQTQVWNGDRHEFVKIFNIAHFNAAEQVWLPLNVGQITCSWCTVTVLALAWDSKRRQLHVAGKFNAIDGRNVPAGLAIYDYDSGHLVAHPGGGLSMRNSTQDGVGTALQLDEESGVLYVMGSFERLTATFEICLGLAAYEIEHNQWTCLADAAHTVLPTGGGNMLLTPYGLMVAGKTTTSTTWPDSDRPYTIALLKTTLKTRREESEGRDDEVVVQEKTYRAFNWSWLPGFDGHDEPLHALANGFGSFNGTVFIAGDDLVAKWSYKLKTYTDDEYDLDDHDKRDRWLSFEKNKNSKDTLGDSFHRRLALTDIRDRVQTKLVPTTDILSEGHIRGAIMAISQMMPEPENTGRSSDATSGSVNITIVIYCVSIGCVIGVIGAILCNKNISLALFPFLDQEKDFKGFTLDTLTYNAVENSDLVEAYNRAMKTRYVHHPQLLTNIDPQQIFLQRIIGEGTFGRVWSAKWRTASVAVKEFVFAQAAVAGKSSMRQEIVEEIIGEAGMMAILRHPNVLQLFGCSLTAQAIWIVSELCSLGSLRQLLDDNEKVLSVEVRLSLALQVAEGMTYLHDQEPNIIHRDLKSHNIFVHETFTDAEDASISSEKNKKRKPSEPYEKVETHSKIIAKIGDWGSARATLSGSKTMTHGVGTACWLAPEVIKHARASKFSDVYGYGIVLWELATREEVYQGLETTQIIAKVANENLRPPVPKDCPWKDLMVQCWAENPKDRLEFCDIVKELNALTLELQKADGQSFKANSGD